MPTIFVIGLCNGTNLAVSKPLPFALSKRNKDVPLHLLHLFHNLQLASPSVAQEKCLKRRCLLLYSFIICGGLLSKVIVFVQLDISLVQLDISLFSKSTNLYKVYFNTFSCTK